MVNQLLLLALANAALSVPLGLMVKRDFAKRGRVSIPVAIWSGAAMHGQALLTMAVAWFDRGALGAIEPTSLITGAFITLFGAAMIALGRGAYASVARVYGLKEDELIDRGIYRWSRNPQYAGYALFLGGISLAAMSIWAFALTALFAIFIHFYITQVEEPHLKKAFGAAYSAYLKRSPRYLGLPSRSRHTKA